MAEDLPADAAIMSAALPMRRARRIGYWGGVSRRLCRRPGAMLGAAVLLLLLIAALLAPWIVPFDPDHGSIIARLKPIGWRNHPLGTDDLGRDMLSRLIYGARVSLATGVIPVAAATLIGGGLGVLAGFGSRLVGGTVMRLMDIFYAFPSVLLAVAISGAMGGGIVDGIIALTLVFIPPMCRVAETATAQVRRLDYIEAARASGAGALAIVRHHVLGNVLTPVLVYASSLVSVSILLSAGLSFLGLSVQPPTADWGLMLSTLVKAIYVVPWVCALPGAAIFLTSVSFSLFSDGLRAAMDVRG